MEKTNKVLGNVGKGQEKRGKEKKKKKKQNKNIPDLRAESDRRTARGVTERRRQRQ
jgi:hypothetical protein